MKPYGIKRNWASSEDVNKYNKHRRGKTKKRSKKVTKSWKKKRKKKEGLDVKHLSVALRLAEIPVNNDYALLIARIYEYVRAIGGSGTLQDIVEIRNRWEEEIKSRTKAKPNAKKK